MAEEKDDKTLLQQLAGVLADYGAWLADALAPDDASGKSRAMAAIVEDLGGTLADGGVTYQAPSLDGIKAYRDAANPRLEAWIDVLGDVLSLIASIRAIAETVRLGETEATIDEITAMLLDASANHYVRHRWPRLHAWMELTRFSAEPMTLFGSGESTKARFGGSLLALIRFALSPLESLGRLGVAPLSDRVDVPPLATDADARRISDAWGLHLAGVLAFWEKSIIEPGFGRRRSNDGIVTALYGWDQPRFGAAALALPPDPADLVSERMLSVQVSAPPIGQPGRELEGALRLSLALVPEVHGGPGFFMTLGGGAFRATLDVGKRWQAQAEARVNAPAAIQFGGREKFRFSGAGGNTDFHVSASFASKPVEAGERPFRFSLGDNGLQVARIVLAARLDDQGAESRVSFHDCRLALDGTSFDNFIGSLLPRTQTSVEFSFGTGYSTRDGFFTTGDLPFASGRGTQPSSAPRALEPPAGPSHAVTPVLAPPDLPVVATGVQGGGIPIQIAIGKSLGPVRLHHVLLNIDRDTAGESPRTLIGAALSFSAQIGPVLARIDRIGLKFALDFPDDRSKANLHFANIDVGFLAPVGIGLAVETEQVKGGGFLFHDEAKHQYAGAMELSLSGIVALKAIGLISTRLPDGSKGYSLLIVVTAETTNDGNLLKNPVMGFRLTGIGGLIAIHRTVSEEALRAGLKNRTLESVMFPKDPIRNAPTVIAALDRVFPIKRGSYLIGVMVRLVWGVPTIITLDLGLILEWAGSVTPSRLVVLGRITSILPRRDHDLLRLNLDAVGIFDFNQGTAAIDAVLVDSRLLNRFPLTGSGALRARWTSPRSFALAVGGLNKGFTPPAEFPKLDRLALSLTTGDNPRLTCEAYFALTANTVQFGAHARLYAAAYGFNVQGEAGFDVLIRLLPFHFLAELYAGMQLRKGSRNLFKVKVEGALEGPIPLALRAKCTFEIFWWDVSIRVNVTLVGGARPPLPVAVDAFVQLRAALSDARSWSAELPAGQSRIVSLRETAGEGLVRVHPLGTLAVRQSVVPLNLDRDIDKFGDSPVAGARRFAVTGVAIEGAAERSSALSEDFAPGQFFEMSDEARIASPSFEPMQAGLRVGATDFAFGFAERVASPLDYETRVIDRSAGAPAPAPTRDYRLSVTLLTMHALHGAAGRSVLRREQPAAAAPFAAMQAPRWSAVAEDLAPLPGATQDLTFVEALGAWRRERQGLVVREFELIRAEGRS